MSPAIEVDHLSVGYGSVRALEDVNLTLRSSTVYGLIGMNGSGKSTLMKAVMGVVIGDRGCVRIGGKPPAAARTAAAIAYMPQSEGVDWEFPISVRDVVMTGRYGHLGFTRRPRRADRQAVDEALERLELTALAQRQIGELSGGQRKRVFVARAVAQDASVLLLDEPFAGVDQRSEGTITALLGELATAGATIVVSTHDLPAVSRLADAAILLKQRVLATGTPGQVITPDNLVRAFGLEPREHIGDDR